MQEFSATTHIDNRRLYNAAAGVVALEVDERKHLHNCEVCQGVMYVFVSQQVTPRGAKTTSVA